MEALNPDALATCGDNDLDTRRGVQDVTDLMITDYVVITGELPGESAGPFGAWLRQNWNDWNEDGELTNGAIITGALSFWRGGR
jgi:hypothetical protein